MLSITKFYTDVAQIVFFLQFVGTKAKWQLWERNCIEISLFQALGQWGRSKSGRGTSGVRAGEKNRGEGAGRRACKHCFKNLIPPTFKKITLQGCQMSKCQCLRCRVTRVSVTTSQRVRCCPCKFHAISPAVKRTQEHLSSSPVSSRSPRRSLALSEVNWESVKGGWLALTTSTVRDLSKLLFSVRALDLFVA